MQINAKLIIICYYKNILSLSEPRDAKRGLFVNYHFMDNFCKSLVSIFFIA